jgi:hypothetical protein
MHYSRWWEFRDDHAEGWVMVLHGKVYEMTLPTLETRVLETSQVF